MAVRSRVISRSPRSTRTSFRIQVLLSTASLAAILATTGGRAGATPRAGDDPAPFTEEIPGTLVTMQMMPMLGGEITVAGTADDTPVTVEPFWIGRTEVTWDAFDAYRLEQVADPAAAGVDAIARPSKPYIAMDRGFGHAGYPVISPSYHSAQTFCRWLTEKTGRRYRLPTEAEWRHACAESGVTAERLDDHAWHRGTAGHQTHPVATKKADARGLHDLFGNASEWCTGVDGQPVTLGGCYRDDAANVGCAARVPPKDAWNASDPQIPKSIWWLADGGFVGFRVVCESPDQQR
ncbi:MAG: formylglycine-generating enzyme family protein [Planctomycetota bacterium]|jgi:formylglycine-generating enzyme required for sulfatase activity